MFLPMSVCLISRVNVIQNLDLDEILMVVNVFYIFILYIYIYPDLC